MADETPETEDNQQNDLSPLTSGFEGNWRGQVIDETERSPLFKWMVGGSVAFSLIVGGGIYYKVTSKTEAEKLAILLSDPAKIRSKLSQYKKVINDITSSSREVRRAVLGLITLTETPLRLETHPHRPFIAEKHEALVYALKGLVRLDVEKMIDLENQRDLAFYTESLHAIGATPIEYFENSIIQAIPLMEQSTLTNRLAQLKESPEENRAEIEELKAEIERVKQVESFTPLPALNILGKWYRYHNKLEKAGECFDIARTYVEGYRVADHTFEGNKPHAIGPVWEEYVASIEGIAEIHIQKKEYRIARAYLTRLLDTPKNIHRLFKPSMARNATAWKPKKLSELKNDLVIIQNAIENPLSVSSFPTFEYSDELIRWNQLQKILIEQTKSGGALADYIKKQAPKHLLEDLEKEKLSQSPRLKQEVVTFLNYLLLDTRLPKLEFFDPHLFTPNGKELYKKGKKYSLSRQELQTLNRDILETNLSDVFSNPYVLSNGDRLSAFLSPKQINFLITLYNRGLEEKILPHAKRGETISRIEKIEKREETPTIEELHQILMAHRDEYKRRVKQSQMEIDQAEARLKELSAELLKLEQKSSVSSDEIENIQKFQKEIRERQVNARYAFKKAQSSLKETLDEYHNLTFGFATIGKEKVKQIELLEQNQKEELSKTEKWEMVLLSQIDTQIDLKEKYLFLLKELKKTGENKTLVSLKERYRQIQGEILKQKELVSSLSGDEREEKKMRLETLQTHQHALLKKIDEIYNPLEKVIGEIAEKEREVYKSETVLLRTRENIAKLIGSGATPGTLAEKAERRRQLLLSQSSTVLKNPGLDEEIEKLNQEISQDHAQLALLLEKEAIAEHTLQTFFPSSISQTELTIPNSTPFSKLKRYLDRQSDLLSSYESLKALQDTRREVFQIYQNLGSLIDKINKTFTEQTDLSETLSIEVNRYIVDLIDNQKRLSLAKQKLEYLKSNPGKRTDHFFLSSKGFYLDNLDRFEIERKMGLQVTEYLSLFDDRKQLLVEIKEALEKKKELDQRYQEAVATRNQKQIDTLTPRLIEHENFIDDLSNREKAINNELRKAQTEFQGSLAKIKAYQNSLQPQQEKIKEQLRILAKALSSNDQGLEDLAQAFMKKTTEIAKTFTNLDIKDLKNLDQMIVSEEEKLARLKKIRTFKVNEQYFQARARWMIAHTFREQGKSEDLETLKDTDIITPQLQEKNTKYASFAYEEFDQVSDNIHTLITDQTGLDEHQALYENWVKFCEDQAIKIFIEDLPKYFLTTEKATFEVAKNIGEKKTNFMYLWRGKGLFETGKIYLSRAHRILRFSRVPATQNAFAQNELQKATSFFLQFQDFTRQRAAILSQETALYEVQIGSQEFPYRKAREVKLDDKALLYLGVASHLSGDYVEAIAYFRGIIQNFIQDAKKADHFHGEPLADPMLAGGNAFQSRVHPVYASLLTQNPLGNEALYRLGKCYYQLAMEAKIKARNPQIPIKKTTEEYLDAFFSYGEIARNYFTQLIHLQAHSPFRKASLNFRARLSKELGDISTARSDLIALATPSPEPEKDPFSYEGITLGGDLPGELNPPFSYVMFELGKLYSDTGLQKEAGIAFFKALNTEPLNTHVFQARVAYAKTLMESEDYFLASYLLKEVIDNKASIEKRLNIVVPFDIYVDYGICLMRQGNFQAGTESLKKLWAYLPKNVLVEGELDLSRPEKLLTLTENYRDTIRPLSLSLLELGKANSQIKEFPLARRYLQAAKLLAGVIPWKEDFELQKLNQDEYRNQKHLIQMKIDWALVETDFDEVSFAATESFRQSAERVKQPLPVTPLLGEISETLSQIDQSKDQFLTVLAKIDRFINEHSPKLPETLEKKNLEIQKALDRKEGKQRIFEFDALSSLYEFTSGFDEKAFSKTINYYMQEFPKETLEGKYLNEFALYLAQRMDLSREERRAFHPSKTNMENLLTYPKDHPILSRFKQELIFWLEGKIAKTGLDESLIPVSPQSALLEEVDLYKVSVLSTLARPQDVKQIYEIAERKIENLQREKSRVTRPDLSYELLDIAALTSYQNQDWDKCMAFNSFLIDSSWDAFHLDTPADRGTKNTLFLAESLVKKSQNLMSELIFFPDEEKQKEAEKQANAYLDRAKRHLKVLEESQGEGLIAISSRVRARKLLEEIGG